MMDRCELGRSQKLGGKGERRKKDKGGTKGGRKRKEADMKRERGREREKGR